MSRSFTTSVECSAQRLWDARAPWLLTLYVPTRFAGYGITSCAQARAVVDDFGNLVAVESFK